MLRLACPPLRLLCDDVRSAHSTAHGAVPSFISIPQRDFSWRKRVSRLGVSACVVGYCRPMAFPMRPGAAG